MNIETAFENRRPAARLTIAVFGVFIFSKASQLLIGGFVVALFAPNAVVLKLGDSFSDLVFVALLIAPLVESILIAAANHLSRYATKKAAGGGDHGCGLHDTARSELVLARHNAILFRHVMDTGILSRESPILDRNVRDHTGSYAS